mmetsp:Transcript_6742/g.18815  ORF Transcript_6742/g.18815 Transcript_6742/m.18815 type:complete len:221 (+) Transcript_6742:234-896(+)
MSTNSSSPSSSKSRSSSSPSPTGSPSSPTSSPPIFHLAASSSILALLFRSISAISSGVLGLMLLFFKCSWRLLSRSALRPSLLPSFSANIPGGACSVCFFLRALSFCPRIRSLFLRSASSSFFVRVLILGSMGSFVGLLEPDCAFLISVLIAPYEMEGSSRGRMEVTRRPLPSASLSLSPTSSPPLTFLNSTKRCWPLSYSGKYSSRFARSKTVVSTLAN